MALTFLGQSQCALCGYTLEAGDAIVATPAIPVAESDPLAPFYDAGMHCECFQNWILKEPFIRYFNAYYDQQYRGMRFMLEDGSIDEREPHAG